jgi:hypothetical protein
MTNQHPITPPPELVQQWLTESVDEGDISGTHLANRAAQWGADQELLACGNYLKQCAQWEEEDVTEFYNYRRPKPPTLKEQALEALDQADKGLNKSEWQQCSDTIRRALEALPDG